MATSDYSWADLPFDTPYLALDLSRVRVAYNELRASLPPNTRIYYAMKANSDPHLLTMLARLGAGFDIASDGELSILEGLRIPSGPELVLYSNPVKPREHIIRTYGLGVRQYTVDSHGELAKLAELAPGSAVYYRLRTRPGKSMVPSEGKFGASIDETVDLIKATEDLGLIPYGISFHVGSQQTNPAAWVAAISDVAEVLERLYRASGFQLQMLNLGGGFPVPYVGVQADMPEITAKIRERLHSVPYVIQPAIEPGRCLVAEAGVMVGTVLGVVRRGMTTWVHTDVGVFNCGFVEILETQGQLWYPISDSRGGETHRVSVAGPSCDSQDAIAHNVPLSKSLREGDRIRIGMSGGYTRPYASADFNGLHPPKTHVVDTALSQPGDHDADVYSIRRGPRSLAPPGDPLPRRRPAHRR